MTILPKQRRTIHQSRSPFSAPLYALNFLGKEKKPLLTFLLFAILQVEQIMLAPKESFAIWSSAALAEIKVNKLSLTFAQGENLLASFVSRGWLFPSQYVSCPSLLYTRVHPVLSERKRVFIHWLSNRWQS